MQEYLGGENTTRIWAANKVVDGHVVGTTEALRIPAYKGYPKFEQREPTLTPEYLNMYIRSSPALHRAGLAPELFESLSGQYAFVKRENIQLTMAQALIERKNTREVNKQLDLAALTFIRKFAAFEAASDISIKQIIWNGEEFRLLDFTVVELLEGDAYPAQVESYHRVLENLFEDLVKGGRNDLVKAMKKAFYEERLAIVAKGVNPVSNAVINPIPDVNGARDPTYRAIQRLRKPIKENSVFSLIKRGCAAALSLFK